MSAALNAADKWHPGSTKSIAKKPRKVKSCSTMSSPTPSKKRKAVELSASHKLPRIETIIDNMSSIMISGQASKKVDVTAS